MSNFTMLLTIATATQFTFLVGVFCALKWLLTQWRDDLSAGLR